MKILVVGGTPARRSGLEQFCDRAIAALGAIGRHEVHLISAHTSYLNLKSTPLIWRAVGEIVSNRRGGWDCIWLQYVNFYDLIILVICKTLGYVVIVTPHLGTNWRSQKSPFLRWLGKQILRLADAIGLLSPSQAQELLLPKEVQQLIIKTFLPSSLINVSRPIDVDGNLLRLMHAGRLSEEKGSLLFLEICAILHRLNFAFHARLIGSCDPSFRAKIEHFLHDHDLVNCVELHGVMAEPELLLELATTDVLVHLSQTDSFPLIVLESIGCGVFPVCFQLPGAQLIVQTYCGKLVGRGQQAKDVVAFLMQHNPCELREIARVASAHLITDYAWHECVAILERAFMHVFANEVRVP